MSNERTLTTAIIGVGAVTGLSRRFLGARRGEFARKAAAPAPAARGPNTTVRLLDTAVAVEQLRV
ncbi:MAG: hypothetical protein JXC32_17670, partial [Anaerolineae bacterium]|nr:hypothetical protein [Anaerolineae bacterium]